MSKSITIIMRDDKLAIKLLDEFCYNHRYKEQIPNPDFNKEADIDSESNPLEILNPENKLNFLKRKTINWWIGEASQGKNRRTYDEQVKEFKTMVIE